MGVGRRMKKQGPPPPLDESKISSLKRRKLDTPEDSTSQVNKRRRSGDNGDGKKTKTVKSNGAKAVAPKSKNTAAQKQSKPAPQRKKTAPEPPTIAEDSESGISDDNDEMDGSIGGEWEDMDEVGDVPGFGSDDSDDEDDSVLDSEDDQPRETMFSDDEDLSDAEEQLTAANIEGLTRKLDLERAEDAAQADEEMRDSALQTNIAGEHPDADQSALNSSMAPNLQFLRTRITDTIRILGDLSTLGQPGKSRVDYTDLLLQDICTYYGYTPYLAEKLFNLFTPLEAFSFFEANETPRPVVIRTNTLRTNRRSLAQALINRGVVLEPVGKWSKVGLQVFESPVPLGATPEYLAGHYILQAASSFLPVMALAPQPHERVLDMAAAPGGKTTYISALMRNTGSVLANDANKQRAKGLIGNIHRLGCKNTIVSNLDARTSFPKAVGGFDRILLDAPCSGTGVISKDPSVKTSKNERDFLALPHMQKQLLLAAIDSINHSSKTGGYVVYSTCSVTVEENEGVVQYALRKRPNVKIVDTGLGDFGTPGFKSYMNKKFDDKMTMTRRYFPHRENVDGFFVCKLKKTGPSPSTKSNASQEGATTMEEARDVFIKTPISDEVDHNAEFGPFDDDEDEAYIARGERNRMRRKGLDPKAVLNGNKKKGTSDQNKATQKESTSKSNKKEKPANKESTGKENEKDKPAQKESAGKEKKKNDRKVKKGNSKSAAGR